MRMQGRGLLEGDEEFVNRGRRSTEGPMPGVGRLETEQDMELQREVEATMMEHLVEENEKLKEELRGLREGRGMERSYQRRTEVENTEVEGYKRWPDDVPRPPQGSPERSGKRPRRKQRYTPHGTQVPESPDQREPAGPMFPQKQHVPKEVEAWLQRHVQASEEQRTSAV